MATDLHDVKTALDSPPVLFSYQASANSKLEQDCLLSFDDLKKRADAGNTSAQLLVALAYRFGMYDVVINQNEYQRYLLMVVQKNDKSPAYLCAMGFCYEWAEGPIKIKNLDKAKECFVEAGKQGYAPATTEYAEMLFRESFSTIRSSTGDTIERKDEAKLKEVVQLLTPLAEIGYQRAQVRLGVSYEDGYGVAADVTQAGKLFEMAANAGEACAKCALARFYYYGQGGFPKSSSKTLELCEASNKQGFPLAKKNLAIYKENYGCCRIL